jgi:hypothetical protein
MATNNYPLTSDLSVRAAHAVMQASLEASAIDTGWQHRFEQLDERQATDCITLAMEAPTDLLMGYLLAKASAATSLASLS